MGTIRKKFYVYILTTKNNKVLYTGITNNLNRRMYEHKSKINECFTKKYNINKLIYFELYDKPMDAISREKQIKSWKRKKKIALINSLNPSWNELSL